MLRHITSKYQLSWKYIVSLVILNFVNPNIVNICSFITSIAEGHLYTTNDATFSMTFFLNFKDNSRIFHDFTNNYWYKMEKNGCWYQKLRQQKFHRWIFISIDVLCILWDNMDISIWPSFLYAKQMLKILIESIADKSGTVTWLALISH